MKRRKSPAVWLALKAWVTLPVAISSAANDQQRRRGVDRSGACAATAQARAQREWRLGSLQRLDGRLLVDTEHDRVFGRAEVEPDDIGHLGGKGRIPAHLVGAREMRLDAVGPQDVGDAAAGAPDDGAQRGASSTGCAPPAGARVRDCRICSTVSGGTAWSRRPVFGTVDQEPVHARLHEAAPDPRHGFRRQVETRGDLRAAQAVGTSGESHGHDVPNPRGQMRVRRASSSVCCCLRVVLTR